MRYVDPVDVRSGVRSLADKVDRQLQARARIGRQQRLEEWNAFCPTCRADILDELEKASYNSEEYGPLEHCTIECPGCGTEVEFDLEWTAVLQHASPALPRGLA